MIKTDNYVFIDKSDGTTKKLKLEQAVKEVYRMLGQYQHSLITQRVELVERITADRVALANRTAGVPRTPSESVSEMDI